MFDEDVIAAARDSADGIFRVWSTDIDNRSSDRLKMFDGNYPLLPGAREIRANYDAGSQALFGCTTWSMPRIMANPLPMEFVKSGENILQRFEEYDSVRVIHMTKTAAELERDISTVTDSTLGYSTGRWDGDILVVETSRITPDRLDDHGTPFSAGLRLLERFSLSSGDQQLDYKLRITDPDTFSAPLETGRQWNWRPEIVVGRYACEEDQQLR